MVENITASGLRAASTPRAALGSGMDVDNLFEGTEIQSIKKLNLQLKKDIDQKKEDLRTMVGERYRDLMEAADTIINMKLTSMDVISTVKQILEADQSFSCHSLEPEAESGDDMAESDIALAAEVKLLMDCSELLWTSVDRKDFLAAAVVFLLARHIHTSLTIDTEISYPVVARQWDSILPFQESIVEDCHWILVEDDDYDELSCIKCLAALVLLKRMRAKTLFVHFLALREKSLKKRLESEGKGAKTRINDFLKDVMFCLRIIRRAFLDEQSSNNLGKMLRDVCRVPAVQSFHLSSMSMSVMQHLPRVIVGFCPSLTLQEEDDNFTSSFKPMPTVHDRVNTVEQLDPDYVRLECTNWLDRIHGLVMNGDKCLILSHVNSIGDLCLIRKEVYEFLKHTPEDGENNNVINVKSWNQLCVQVMQRTVNLWNEFFRNVFRDRVEYIVTMLVGKAVTILKQELLPSCYHEDISKESNLSEYIWSEAGSSDGGSTLLKMKSKAYSSRVRATCKQFDDQLKILLKDLSCYVGSYSATENGEFVDLHREDDVLESEPFQLDQDNEPILDHVQKTTLSSIISLVETVQRSWSEERCSLKVLYAARLCQAVLELSPCLKSCACATREQRPSMPFADWNSSNQGGRIEEVEWNEIAGALHKESCRLLKIWIRDKLLAKLASDFESYLEIKPTNLKHLLPQWAAVEVSEEDEDGKTVVSTIRVPYQISVGLHLVLNDFAKALYEAGVHAMASEVQVAIPHLVLEKLQAAFTKLSSAKLTQNCALQLHFDVQFVIQLMAASGQDEEEKLQSVLTSLEQHIDPFDMSVFSPFVSTNVKKAVLRHHSGFGVFVPAERHALLMSMKAAAVTSTASNDHHNSMLVSESSARFPLLPISHSNCDNAASKRAVSLLSGTLVKTTGNLSKSEPAPSAQKPIVRKRDKSPVARAAGSFFEAMSNSWFGGGK